ncbi:reverse transcriptase domain-containing protein [Singulisphaera sp. Ch08]|uniref:Reverse transcriptase domain-containing protein n=1 Tax=Singulisphaera sp. Ch08 TaxID=3120278 RepID=A0AAU7CK62_9BACT
MGHSTTQFITQMKLRELRRQRSKLREAYEGLSEEVADDREPRDRLRELYDGLRGLTFAGQALHPDVVNLEVLLHEAEAGAASEEVVALWVGRLEEELAAGRARSEVVYLFGALLEDWARGEAAEDPQEVEARQARDRLMGTALSEAGPNDHGAVLAPLFENLGPALGELAGRLEKASREVVGKPVSTSELEIVLLRLAEDIYRPADLRGEARRFAKGAELRKELADALTILFAELPSWDWPDEGLKARATWTRNKWRLYLDEDLPTACLLEILGERWVRTFEGLVGDRAVLVTQRRARVQKLIDLGSPEVIMANERRMLRIAEQMVELGSPEVADPWAAAVAGSPSGVTPAPEGGSVVYMRADHQASLRSLRGAGGGDYDGDYGETNQAVLLVHAEVQLARAAYPDRPLYLVKLDLKDFYPSIPHDVVLDILRRLGVPEAHLGIFARYLSPPLRSGAGASTRARRGVPMGHTLSGMLAELLMRLLEQHVQRRAPVRIVRIVDDLCVLTTDPEGVVAAWEAVESFCSACGLEINREKSGALVLGGERSDLLPAGRPRWGMLELDELGHCHVHRETFEAHLEQSRARVEAAPSVLSKVQVYNANLKHLLNAVVLEGRLGDSHRESAERTVLRYHHEFFGPGRGITAGLRAEIGRRFQADLGGEAEIAEGWLYWPITAGGLGLRNPLVVTGQYAAADRDREPEPVPAARPADWNLRDNDWGAYYAQFLERIEPLEPEETKVMETLLKDFIARGSEISAGQQSDLAPYWRWILCTYGPQILRRFGTFRFLITELVPLQLIGRQLDRDSSLDDVGRPA